MSTPSLPTAPQGYEIADLDDPFERHAGPFFSTIDGHPDPHLMLQATATHCNCIGTVHGGCLMTMMDLWLCRVAIVDSGTDVSAITISQTNNFTGAGYAGDLLIARATVVRRTYRMAFVQGEITRGDAVLLTASAVLKRGRAPAQ